MFFNYNPLAIAKKTSSLLLVVALASALGCSQNPYLASSAGGVWNAPGGASAAVDPNQARLAELNRRVQLLDDNNRQLHTQLAQSEQQSLVYRDELELIRKQLSETSAKLESASIAANEAENRVRGFQASAQQRGGASIKANTDLLQAASRLNLGGIPVEQNGEVIRIVIPADQLFQPGTNQMLPQASMTLDPIAAQLRSLFPRQRIGIEGYTDDSPLYGGQVATSHQLAAGQAAGVLELLTRRAGMPPNQLFTVAQGANNPRQPNTTAAGRAANRRIELVIYPDTY
ncbi:flagellar motor protein MotB [Rhodopirellula maiorica SM1]|uniref:Flagellar motor protein MotB n=1 Tax=Rhodopirellula maiorica SM1 TaxID=1265738 RepID=M5S0K0_9BACT|nr:OmpA family protein [Rhodopirellula maiorica]EMI19689.1 flagellar motor protein MotB [Rhodopirellula maiorica SM1]